ncbi:cytochrome P450 [Stachybotrys elegans]|uniref:Cytochrome P450 n=1 Tax=Stachybotrys elegans TaxID=80388 RepID=A0A8K0SPA8_9HYPO|nr:cytochrome P450 [Stachybotrys elegans]
MDSFYTPLRIAAATGLIVGLGYLALQKAYPEPLPGIPYNPDATKRLTGDMKEMTEEVENGGSFRSWFLEQPTRHQSAITQVFLGPLSKPAVIVSDFREVSDILKHREGVDIKRGLKMDAFRGLFSHAFPAMETYDPRFKPYRDLGRDLMTPSFLNNINGPRIHDVVCELLDLWRLKVHLAKDHPFDIFRDLSELSFDVILSAAMGLGAEGGDIRRQFDRLARQPAAEIDSSLTDDTDDPIIFNGGPQSAKLSALCLQVDSLCKSMMFPWPAVFHRLNKLRPRVRAAEATLQGHVVSQIAQALPRLSRDDGEPHCALDYVVQREIRAAAKQGRVPELDDPQMHQAVSGYLIAGHDTSLGSFIWLIRRLMLDRRYQDLIREDLRATYWEAYAAGRVPTAAELTGSRRSAWLDAFIQEVLRLDTPLNIIVMTRYDTILLGHHVPADTRVILNLTGPGISAPSVPVDEKSRSATSRAHKASGPARENWDDAEPHLFKPERWLRHDADGKLIYDGGLGPELAFSAGNRGCWGKRLAYLELRIVMALLIWSFEFELPRKFWLFRMYIMMCTALTSPIVFVF